MPGSPSVGLRQALPKLANRGGARNGGGGGAKASNCGLELARYSDSIQSGGEQNAKSGLFERVADAPAPDVYKSAFERWKATLAAIGAETQELKASGRVIVGLGAENVFETAITTHPVYGVPFIPGSALKGLARHYFLSVSAQGADRDKHVESLFGDQGKEGGGSVAAGCVAYLDAWWSPIGEPFARDVLTSHHPKYYGSQGVQKARADLDRGATDFDDPNPVPFLSARGSFLFAVSGPRDEWNRYALDLLCRALEEWGVGGKTSSGYGRFAPDPSSARESLADARVRLEQKIKNQIRGPGDFASITRIIDAEETPAAKRLAAELLKQKAMAFKKWNNDTVDRGWRKAIEEHLP